MAFLDYLYVSYKYESMNLCTLTCAFYIYIYIGIHVQPSCKPLAGGAGVAKSPGSRPGHKQLVFGGHMGTP